MRRRRLLIVLRQGLGLRVVLLLVVVVLRQGLWIGIVVEVGWTSVLALLLSSEYLSFPMFARMLVQLCLSFVRTVTADGYLSSGVSVRLHMLLLTIVDICTVSPLSVL